MKKQLLNAWVVFVLLLISGFSASAQGTYTLCSIPGNATTDSTGTLYDTGGPNGQYQNNENCTLLIAPSCAVSITLTFQSFATEANFDFFQVYDGPTVTAPQLLNANGTTVPNAVTCTSGYMLIVWRSDISIVNDGFECSWTSIIAPSVAPSAAFVVSDYTPPLATGVQFSDLSVGGPTGWLWDFGDGDTARSQNPVHAYSAPGTYTVTFVAFSCTESDTATTTVTVQAAPQINVDPDTFNVTAQCGDSVALYMDVANIAGGELFWTSEVDVNTGLPVRVVIMKYGTDQFSEYRKTITAIDTFFSNYTLTQTGTISPGVLSSLLFGTNVLVIPEQEQGDTAVWATLAPTIQNFINNGGSVIWCGAYSSQASCMFNAGVFTGTFDSDAVGSQLTVTDPSHPLAQGVNNPFNAPAATYVMNITNSNKQTIVADQGVDAVTFVPYGSGKAIFMAFDFFTLTGDNCRIMSNAIQWGGLNGLPTWISLSQTNDTVNAPDTTHVLVTFQTTGLPAGTYISAIPVANNDPTNPVVLVPCTLNISGDPIIALSDTCVNFGQAMQYRPETRVVNVINNGCDTLLVSSITSNAPEFTVTAPFTYLVPGASGQVTVRFVANTVGTFSGTISILNNDVDTTVCMTAETYPAPDVNATVNSVTVNVPACQSSATQTFSVQNLGGSDLIYQITNLAGWMSSATTGDTVTSGGAQTVTLTFNSGNRPSGTYTRNITIASNDPLTPSVQVACTMIVGNNPCMDFNYTSNTCTGETNFTSVAINNPTSYSWTFGDGGTSTQTNPIHYYSANGSYTVQLIACNGAGCDTVTQQLQAIITGPPPTNCYPITSAYCCGIGLTRVNVANINKLSNDAIDGYSNYTCTDTTTLSQGSTYTFYAETGFTYTENVLAWIDWNGDNVLDPVAELIFSDNNVLTFHQGNFTVPGNAIIGQPLRLRVASDYSANPTPTPCLDLQFGQVEDYSVLISLPVSVKETMVDVPFTAYPNPFTAGTRIEYTLKNTADVSLEVYNVVGEKMQTIVAAEKQVAGKHTFTFEGAAPGIYSVRLTIDGQSLIRKIVKM